MNVYLRDRDTHGPPGIWVLRLSVWPQIQLCLYHQLQPDWQANGLCTPTGLHPPSCVHTNTHTQEDKQHLSVKSGTISEAVLAWFLSQWFLFYSLVRLGHAATPVPEPTSGQKYDSALVSPIKAEDNWSKDGTKNSGSKMKTTFWHWATPFLSKLQNPKLVY